MTAQSDVRAFFFHFNKPASRAAQKPQISVHTKGKCLIVDNVVCEVPVTGRIKKRQPVFVMAGRGQVAIKDGVAYIQSEFKSWEAVYLV